MRVTNKQKADIILYDIFRQSELLFRAQERVASGKKINQPSDDPIGMGKILDYRKSISSIDQHNKNIFRGKTWLDIAETALGEVYDLLNTAKNIAVNESSGEYDTRVYSAAEVQHIYDQVLQLANSRVGNSYIFAGHETGTVPFSRDANYNATYAGDSGDIQIITGENVSVNLNVDGNETFTGVGVTGGVNIFDILRDLITGLENADTAAGTTQISNQVAELESAIDQIQDARGKEAGISLRLETTENQLARLKVNVEDMLSETQDLDMVKAVLELQVQETAYQTALQMASRIIQPSLLDFI
jgi:flagellar hook-associated protein 3 FlgL